METVYVLMPQDVAKKLESGKAVGCEEIPDPWEGTGDPMKMPERTIHCYKDDAAAKSECQLAQAILNVKLSIAQVNLKEGRLKEFEQDAKAPDPSSRLIINIIHPWEFISAFHP